MEFLLYYLLRASVVSALFYAVYKAFFARNTFHAANRWLLVCMVPTVFVLPLFRFALLPERQPVAVEGGVGVDLSSLPPVALADNQLQAEIPWMQIGAAVFVAGFLFTVVRYLVGLVQIGAIIRKAERRETRGGAVLCVTDRNVSPFSWMKYIVLSRKDWSGDSRAIICHEEAHIGLGHSVDRFFFDIFTCIFWFNPFSWFLRHEIQAVHEYQADERVLREGADAKQYQLLLIRKSVGDYKFALANNLRQSDLHKRITMMKKDKTNRQVKWSYAMELPVLFLAMVALSVSKLNAVTPVEVNGKAAAGETVEKMAVGVEAKDTVKISIKDVDASADTLDLGKNEVVLIKAKSPKKANQPVLHNTDSLIIISVEGYKKETEPTIAISTTPKVSVTHTPSNRPDSTGRKPQSPVVKLQNPDGSRPLIVVDSKKMPEDFRLDTINPDEIESISVLKDISAVELYGNEAKNGVIIITKKSSGKKE